MGPLPLGSAPALRAPQVDQETLDLCSILYWSRVLDRNAEVQASQAREDRGRRRDEVASQPRGSVAGVISGLAAKSSPSRSSPACSPLRLRLCLPWALLPLLHEALDATAPSRQLAGARVPCYT